MKILLLGEFSGVHSNLKLGLAKLGHSVTLASDGDGFKGFSYDIAVAPYKSKYLGKLFNILHFLINIRKYIGYDVVQFISPFAFPYYFYYLGLPKLVFWFNRKSLYYACGTDPAYLASENKLKYFPFEKNSPEKPDFNKKNKLSIFNWFIKNIDNIVPSMYEYYLGYAHLKKTLQPIPLPCSGSYSVIRDPKNRKLIILFGITRREIKGASHILEALERIISEHPNLIEISIVEKLPFSEYVDLIENTDILIDQCKSYSYGMNALFAMERGVIVMSGSEPEAMNYLGIKDSSVINIIPDAAQVLHELTILANTKVDDLVVLKKALQDQAKTYHDPSIIAEKFITVYKRQLEEKS